MPPFRPSWRLVVTLLLLLGAGAVVIGMTGPNAGEPMAPVSPYDPLPRW